jgi:hypothetical protein
VVNVPRRRFSRARERPPDIHDDARELNARDLDGWLVTSLRPISSHPASENGQKGVCASRTKIREKPFTGLQRRRADRP